jgi:hypothetical protein
MRHKLRGNKYYRHATMCKNLPKHRDVIIQRKHSYKTSSIGKIMAISKTTERVSNCTSAKINKKIKQHTDLNIIYYAANINEIDARLEELDREWDIERTLEVNAATISVAGMLLGILVNRKWLLLPTIVSGFLMQHAIHGWCPSLAAYRRLGVRTQTEIERERYALKALRGDFDQICQALPIS